MARDIGFKDAEKPPPRERPDTNTVTIAGSTFVVDKRYTIVKSIGHGAYGVVWCAAAPATAAALPAPPRSAPAAVAHSARGPLRSAADDTRMGKKVAVKKIANTFNDLTDAKRILREIKLMRHFKHENVWGGFDLI